MRPPTSPLRLVGRSSSHFTRVVRMMAIELDVPLAMEVVHDLLGTDRAPYGGHPALKIPTLHVGGRALFGTDNLCRKLAELVGRDEDPRIVLSHHLRDDVARNAQELIWHAMSAQVQLLLGVRVAHLPAENAYFVKAREGLSGALGWLEEHLEEARAALPAEREVSVLELSLYGLLTHLTFRPTVPIETHRRLAAFADELAARPSARQTPYVFDPRAPAPP